MTTTDAEVRELRQRLEKSEATRAKLRTSLIALKVCVFRSSPPPPPPPPPFLASKTHADVAGVRRRNLFSSAQVADRPSRVSTSSHFPCDPLRPKKLQASLSTRAPVLEAVGTLCKPAASEPYGDTDRNKPAPAGGNVETAARGVEALLAELAAARAQSARWESEARHASATSRAEASEERIRRIAAEAKAETAVAEAALVTAPLTAARAAEDV